jgi:hypothetical protein
LSNKSKSRLAAGIPPPIAGAGLELEIRRDIYTARCTQGQLLVNGAFECYTLEDRAQPVKVAGATCIPAGRYAVAINRSPRFQRLLPQLLEVPGFEGVRIHPGNSDADTEGCILVGQTRAENFVGLSRAAFRKLFGKLRAAQAAGAEIRLTIVDGPPEERGRASPGRADGDAGE